MNPLLKVGLCVAVLAAATAGRAAAENPDGLDGCNVVWNSLGQNYRDSMPVGNGDLGLNVWTEQNGDLVFLIGKTDAYTENGELVKLGRVRVSLTPNPFVHAGGFQQELRLRDGEIVIRDQGGDGAATLRIWVDANNPAAAHVEYQGGEAVALRAAVELWRLAPRETRQEGKELFGRGVFRELNGIPDHKVIVDPDTILPAKPGSLAWCHRNERSIYPLVFENQHLASLLPKYPDPLLHRTFGAVLSGPGLVSVNNQTLQSSRASSTQRLDLFAKTAQTPSVDAWRAGLDGEPAAVPTVEINAARSAHQAWWHAFWDRSWINVTGSDDAHKVTQGYVMQRYMDACAGRGALPIKYNGSIFTVGQEPAPGTPYDPAKGQTDADFRFWGGNSWFQNTRLLYWPMIAAGDDDLLAPFFKQYRDSLALATDRTKLYFHHEGAAFPETLYFWGLPGNGDFGWGNPGDIIRNTWIRHYVSGGLELTAMMLERYDYTQDAAFARQTLLPIAAAVTAYYDQHWPRGADGKIRFDPAQSLETRQQAVNPTPDIAGLMDILPRLLALPTNLTTDAERTMWKHTLADLPPLPLGKTGPDGKIPDDGKAAPDGQAIILPAEKYSKPANVENTEMYAVFPYRIYGVGKPDLTLARDTFAAKLFKSSTCWGHDGLDAAMLGLGQRAKAEAIANFTAYGGERFKWFWKEGHDAEPDMDNGGAGMSILQLMLLQPLDGKIQVFPAWPKDWNVDFKLRAPDNTIVSGVYRDGQWQTLTASPAARTPSVVRMPAQ
jgi:alpha-L-fucosidase 2